MKTILLLAALLWAPAFAEEPSAKDPVQIHLTTGDQITGKVSTVREGFLTLVTDMGVIRIPVERLAESTKKALGLTPASEETERQNRLAEMEALIERLRAENSALRQQLSAKLSPKPTEDQPPTTSPSAPQPAAPEVAKPKETEAPPSYWISANGKRHNAHCRYFGTGAGHNGSATEGTACKVCGG